MHFSSLLSHTHTLVSSIIAFLFILVINRLRISMWSHIFSTIREIESPLKIILANKHHRESTLDIFFFHITSSRCNFRIIAQKSAPYWLIQILLTYAVKSEHRIRSNCTLYICNNLQLVQILVHLSRHTFLRRGNQTKRADFNLTERGEEKKRGAKETPWGNECGIIGYIATLLNSTEGNVLPRPCSCRDKVTTR